MPEMKVLQTLYTYVSNARFVSCCYCLFVQINISNELAEAITNLVRSGIIERGVFHEAALSVFTALIHYWKK
jgi:hypothetical protein